MSFRSSLSKFRSPEGPFSRCPKWLKEFVPNIANVLGIGIYELEEIHRAHIARFIARDRDATLFLFFRILQEVMLLSDSDDSEFSYTGHVLHRLFGSTGSEVIVAAVAKYKVDNDAVNRAKKRGYILAHAAIGNPTVLTSMPEFEMGIVSGRELMALDSGIKLTGDVELAFWGLHYLWFSKLLISDDFSEWIKIMVTGDAAAVAMVEAVRMMDPK